MSNASTKNLTIPSELVPVIDELISLAKRGHEDFHYQAEHGDYSPDDIAAMDDQWERITQLREVFEQQVHGPEDATQQHIASLDAAGQFRVITSLSEIDNVPIVTVETAMPHRIYVNDGTVFDGDPEQDQQIKASSITTLWSCDRCDTESSMSLDQMPDVGSLVCPECMDDMGLEEHVTV